ncbi:MAG: signal peptidase II [Caldilineales bacterium]|nr:signal peptidase II [Caldilineales bacterium]
MIKNTSWRLVIQVAVLVLLLDRFSKQWVLNNLALYETWEPIPALEPYIRFIHVTNTGVSFGMLKQFAWFWTMLAGIAVIAIFIYSMRMGPQPKWVSVSLGMMLGGAAGNLWDRLAYGHVIDFVDVRAPGLFHFATFNVADSSLVIGTILLMLYFLLEERRSGAQKESDPSSLLDQT